MSRVSRLVRTIDFPLRAPTVPGGVEPTPAQRRTGIDYDTEWARRRPAKLARAVLTEAVARPVLSVVARPDRQGLDRLDGLDGPVIVVANHHSHVDTPLLITSLPERFRRDLVVGAAADYFFGTRVTSALSALTIGAIPIERTRINRRSADLAAALVAEGASLLIYPEGGRSPDGWGQPFRGGAAYLSLRCDVPVVPVYLAGTGRILPKGRSTIRRSRTTVLFGTPLRPGPDEDSRRFGARIERAVAELGDELTTDWWTARRNAHAGTTPSLSGPATASWRRAWALGEPSGRRRRSRRAWPDLG